MRFPLVPILAATALILTACANQDASGTPQNATGDKTYGDLPFWDGDVCVEILPNGKRSIVSKSQCPPKT